MGEKKHLAVQPTDLIADAKVWQEASDVVLRARDQVAVARRTAESSFPGFLNGDEVSAEYVRVCRTLWALSNQGQYILDYGSRALLTAAKAYRDAEEMTEAEVRAIKKGWHL